MKVVVGQGSCGVATGARKTSDELERLIAEKGLTNVAVDLTGCVGTCYLEPIVDVYGDDGALQARYVKVQPDKAAAIVEEHLMGGRIVEDLAISRQDEAFLSQQKRIVLRNCGVINPEHIEEYIAAGGYEAAKKAVTSMTPQQVIEEVRISGLRGRGGAGFPTWFKWNAARQNQADQKYMVCNADEGDPGAFMDRSVLEGDPHSVLEGMLIGGYAIGASQGVIYVRAEYPLAIKRLEIAMAQARERGFLGQNLFGTGFSFDIRIKAGAGAFVCGEETALIASLEGERGMPRLKPPFPGSCSTAARPWRPSARKKAPAPRSLPWRARSRRAAWWRCPWACPSATSFSASAAASKTTKPLRPCRWAAPPAAVSPRNWPAPPWTTSPSPRPAPS